ncbi:MAG: indole-3-glycerol phosphate synthase TrpC [Syntrophomonas sp.]
MLTQIAASKREALQLNGNQIMDSFAECHTLPIIRNFLNIFLPAERVKLIAEVKKASPSKGMLQADLDPVRLARTYEENGADAVSVITEETFFLGSPGFVPRIKDKLEIPILRKDFIIDERQLYETRMLGADAVLLIARLLPGRLLSLVELALELGLEPLVEAHDQDEIKRTLDTPARAVTAEAARHLIGAAWKICPTACASFWPAG